MARAEAMAGLALRFSGYGSGYHSVAPLPLAETASWDRTGAPSVIGKAAIVEALAPLTAPSDLYVTQIVIEGRAATVSGHLTREQGAILFCHVLRFTTPERSEIAQIVSFEHRQ